MADTYSQISKRMRLGTRSCVQCRRRKVRCIFADGQTACENCTIRNEACTSQQTTRNAPSIDTTAGSEHDVQQRLEIAEALIAQLQQSIATSNSSPRSNALLTNVSDTLAISNHGPNSTSSSNSNGGSTSRESIMQPDQQWQENFMATPLLDLIRKTLSAQADPPASVTGSSFSLRAQDSSLRRLQDLLPDASLLVSLLQATEAYWFLWPVPPCKSPASVVGASKQVSRHLQSTDPILIAKGLLWLTLCAQQLVGDNRRLVDNSCASQEPISKRYFTEAVALMHYEAHGDHSRDFLDCLNLQMKVYINLGRPHRAWHCARRVVDLSLLLGFDRAADVNAESHAIFLSACQYDRNLGSIIGMPPCVSENDPGLTLSGPAASWEFRAMHKISIIGGRISERDRGKVLDNYSITERLDAALDEFCEDIPTGSWLAQLPNGHSIPEYFGPYLRELYMHCYRKTLHMPYFLGGPGPYHDKAQRSVIESARSICILFKAMRGRSQGWLMMCDLADFQVFTGVLTLVLALLYPCSGITAVDRDSDWQLVDSVTALFRQSHKLLNCMVAGQAVDVLENLLLARHGLLSTTETYAVSIPYFGRFRIRYRAGPGLVTPDSLEHQRDASSPNSGTNFIQFDANVAGLPPYSRSPGPFDEFDMSSDWLTGDDFGADFDWAKAFEPNTF